MIEKDQEFIDRLRISFGLDKAEVSDDEVLKVCGDTLTGASVRLKLEIDRLFRAIKREFNL